MFSTTKSRSRISDLAFFANPSPEPHVRLTFSSLGDGKLDHSAGLPEASSVQQGQEQRAPQGPKQFGAVAWQNSPGSTAMSPRRELYGNETVLNLEIRGVGNVLLIAINGGPIHAHNETIPVHDDISDVGSVSQSQGSGDDARARGGDARRLALHRQEGRAAHAKARQAMPLFGTRLARLERAKEGLGRTLP
jgi:hypothetical protein